MTEARIQQSRATTGYLRRLPALALVDRLPTSMLGVGQFGDVTYANPAFAELLGYPDAASVTRLHLPDLLSGLEEHPPADCLHHLRTAASVVEWNHEEGYVIRTVLSAPLLLRATDLLLLIGITDVTAWLWETTGSGRSETPGARSR